MLLRVSGERTRDSYNLEGILGEGDVGVPDEDILLQVAEAVYHGDETQLAKVRQLAGEKLGPLKLVDAIAVASAFNGITRVANATGLPLDDHTEQMTVEMRQLTGIDAYSEQVKSGQFD